MRLPKRGEKGFTLIELLIVVAILGVLAAVVIPNIGQFIGAGEEEAKDTELSNIQAAVHGMMVDNKIATLLNPVDDVALPRTQDMGAFPDTSATANGGAGDKDIDPGGSDYEAADQDGYYLYQHDITGDGLIPPTALAAPLVNYVATATTTCWYSVDAAGTVTQHETATGP